MKITTLILLMALMQVSAASVAQRITFVKKNASLEQVFQEITRQTGYEVFYGDKKFDDSRKISVAFKDATLDEVLKTCLQHQRASYVIEEKSIIIKPAAEPTFLERVVNSVISKDMRDLIDLYGRVVDQEGKPLPGATVKVKSTGKSVSTNTKGEFYLEKVEEGGVLLVSFIGYVSREVKARKERGDITLELSDSKLDELQVIAYGTTTRRLSTGNVSTVKAEDIAKSPVSNPLLAIAGRVPGVFISQTSGLSTGAVDVTIQGKNSIAKNNIPFYIIDGVPYSPNTISTPVIGAGITAGIPTATGFINPNDIESIEILKDGDATAIYGARAANGAILITTKSGKAGKTKVDINMQTGQGKVAKRPDLLNTEQYLVLRKETYKNAVLPQPTVYEFGNQDLTVWDQNRYTDWQKELIGGTAQNQNFHGSISGGNESTQFLVGGTYIRETTVFPGDFSNVKGGLNFNINHASPNRRFHFTFSGNYLQSLNTLPQSDLTTSSFELAPNAPALYNDDGSINWSPLPGASNSFTFTNNPAAGLLRRYKNKTNNLIGNGLLSYEILTGLTLKSSFGYNKLNSDEIGTVPRMSFAPNSTAKRSATYSNSYVDTWIVEPQVTYNRSFSFGNIDALIGTTMQETLNYMRAYRGVGFSNDSQLENIFAAPTVTATGALESDYRYGAIFGRFNYRYKDTYILNFSIRRDGSSRFGSENVFNDFYSIAGAWLFSNNEFVKNNFSFLSFGKLRASYGTTGNDGIGDYSFLDIYTNYGVGVPYQGIIGLTTNQLPNPYLKWEETKKINIGLDLAFLKDKFVLTTNYFCNRSSNQLLNYNLSNVTGFGAITRNLPATVQNTGWEFLLDLNPVHGRDFNWQNTFNLTIPNNKLIRYDNLSASADANQYVIGKSINISKLYKFEGVNPETGLYQVVSHGGGYTSSPTELDRRIIVSTDPKFYGGFSNSFSYKGINFDFLVQFVHQKGANILYPDLPFTFIGNQMKNTLDHWRSPGDKSMLQQITQNQTDELYAALDARGGSDAAISDASYARLRNASLSYNLPGKWLQKAHISQARIYMQGQNLFTLSNFYGTDPETKSKGTLAPLRIYTIGFQLTL